MLKIVVNNYYIDFTYKKVFSGMLDQNCVYHSLIGNHESKNWRNVRSSGSEAFVGTSLSYTSYTSGSMETCGTSHS